MTDHNYADRTWFQPPANPGSAIGRVMFLMALVCAIGIVYAIAIAILSLA